MWFKNIKNKKTTYEYGIGNTTNKDYLPQGYFCV